MSAHEAPTKRENEDEQWELIAGELAAAMHAERAVLPTDAADVIPSALAERVIAGGESMVSRLRAPIESRATGTSMHPRVRRVVPTVSARAISIASGWLAAAAVFAFWIASSSPSLDASIQPAALRDSILSADSTASTIGWAATADASTRSSGGTVASGDVVWSARARRGVMRFAGLAPNDRKRWQYQLWIFDKRRDQRYPVDGGVFDIPAGSREVLIPINARIPVGEALMFAITVEPAGGVVVSTRERIALVAKVGG